METIKIDWENCFGIGKLNHEFNFGAQNSNSFMIYAPNGTMKTSFAKTFDLVSKNVSSNMPCDKVHINKVPKYEIYSAGIAIEPDSILVINAEDNGFDASHRISNFLASADLKRKYEEIYSELSVASAFVSAFFPPINFAIGDWNVSMSPAIAFGNASGTGVNIGVGYSDGDWSVSGGVGLTSYSDYNGFGINSSEIRYSALVNYDDGKTGFSLGTNFWRGDFKQQTGTLGLHNGDFRALYENDGKPFTGFSGDGNDQYRTAALSLSVKDISVGFNLFTGQRTKDDYKYEDNVLDIQDGKKNGLSSIGKYGEHYKNGLVNERDTPYRLGALTVGYKGYNAGINSEWVRHGIQNVAIHGTFIANQRMFEMKSNSVNGYIQYKTPNQFTTW